MATRITPPALGDADALKAIDGAHFPFWRDRCVAFMDAVELLCRTRNFWIVAAARSDSRTWPTLRAATGEEAGYRMAKSESVTTFNCGLHEEMPRGPSHQDLLLERFIEKLTALSVSHGIWLQAQTTWPKIDRLSSAINSRSARYTIQMVDNAGGFATTLD